MKFGLTPEQYQFLLKHVIRPLETTGATIWCYGSRARGDHHQFSDIDLMVENEKNPEKELSQINEFLENSNFPYKVDLVWYGHFADSYKKNYKTDKRKFS